MNECVCLCVGAETGVGLISYGWKGGREGGREEGSNGTARGCVVEEEWGGRECVCKKGPGERLVFPFHYYNNVFRFHPSMNISISFQKTPLGKKPTRPREVSSAARHGTNHGKDCFPFPPTADPPDLTLQSFCSPTDPPLSDTMRRSGLA